jgi:hypothetical protein
MANAADETIIGRRLKKLEFFLRIVRLARIAGLGAAKPVP